MLKAVSAPLVEVEPDEEQWNPEYEEDTESPGRRRSRSEGIANEDMVKVMDAFLGLLKNFQTAAPVINVDVTPTLKLEPHKEVKTISRDERGRLSSIETEIK